MQCPTSVPSKTLERRTRCWHRCACRRGARLCIAELQRRVRLRAVDRLDQAFLVDRQHYRVAGPIHVKADHIQVIAPRHSYSLACGHSGIELLSQASTHALAAIHRLRRTFSVTSGLLTNCQQARYRQDFASTPQMPKMVDGQGEVVLAVVKSGISETSGPVSPNRLRRQACVVIGSIRNLRLNLGDLDLG